MTDEMSEMLIHTCAITQASLTAGAYGHAQATWSGPVTPNVPCLLVPQTKRELLSGAVIATHLLYVLCAQVPASLRALGAERTHRVSDVAADGAVFAAGPFDVVEITDAGGRGHHLEMRLKLAI